MRWQRFLNVLVPVLVAAAGVAGADDGSDVLGLIHTAVGVSDLDRALHFYQGHHHRLLAMPHGDRPAGTGPANVPAAGDRYLRLAWGHDERH